MTTKYQSLSGRILTAASAPSTPVEGDMYFDTTLKTLRRYNGSSWLSVQQISTTSTSTSSSTSTSTSTTTST